MSAEVPSQEQLLNLTTVFLSPECTPVDLANMRCRHCYRTPQWSLPASKPGKLTLPTNIQNGN